MELQAFNFIIFLLTYNKDIVSEITDYDTHGLQRIDFSVTVELFSFVT